MIDKNPQSGAKELTIPDNVKDMAFVEDSDGGIWACPVCKTDEHLIDL